MKKKKRLLFILVTFSMTIFSSCAVKEGTSIKKENSTVAIKEEEQTEETSGLGYRLSLTGDYYIATGLGTVIETDIVIAEKYKGKLVKEIDDFAFQNCRNLTSVVIPKSITKIPQGAFKNCGNIKAIYLPQTITSIGNYAFENSKNLVDIILPSSLRTIGEYAFTNCGIKSIMIPKNVVTIGEYAFFACSNLSTLIISGELQEINQGTFRHCEALADVKLPDSIKILKTDAFSMCKSLKEIILPQSIERIEETAFFNDDYTLTLSFVYYKGTEQQWGNVSNEDIALDLTKKYYYSKTKPTVEGNYWRYVDSKPIIWE